MAVKYEVWGRDEKGKRHRRLAFGFSSETDARMARAELMVKGVQDAVVVQRPATYGKIRRLQRSGLLRDPK